MYPSVNPSQFRGFEFVRVLDVLFEFRIGE